MTNVGQAERKWLLYEISVDVSRTQPAVTHWVSIWSLCARLPISGIIEENGSLVQIYSFTGDKYILRFPVRTALCSLFLKPRKSVEDFLLLLAENYIELYSNVATLIQQATTIKKEGYQKAFGWLCLSENGAVLNRLVSKICSVIQPQKQDPGF